MIGRRLVKDEDIEVNVKVNGKDELFKITVVNFGERFNFCLDQWQIEELIEGLKDVKEKFDNYNKSKSEGVFDEE